MISGFNGLLRLRFVSPRSSMTLVGTEEQLFSHKITISLSLQFN